MHSVNTTPTTTNVTYATTYLLYYNKEYYLLTQFGRIGISLYLEISATLIPAL